MQKMDELIPIIEDFNRKVKLLTLNLYNRNKNDPVIFRTKERIILVCNMDPKLVIDSVGKGLYKFKDRIYDMDDEFALSYDFTQELPDNLQDVKVVMNKLKDIWKTMEADERQEFGGLVQDLLDDYIEYLSIIHLQ
jgi:hypothetical protein